MSAMIEQRSLGTAREDAIAHLRTASKAARQDYDETADGQPIIRTLAHDPVMLSGHAFTGVVYSTAGDSPRIIGLMCIAAMAKDDVPFAIGTLNQHPTSGYGSGHELESAEWVIIPIGRTMPTVIGRETAARIPAAKVPRLGAGHVKLLPASLEHPVVIVDAVVNASSIITTTTGMP